MFGDQDTRIKNRLLVAREGFPFILVFGALSIIFYSAGLVIPAVIMAGLSIFTIFFFRDPERKNDGNERAVFTPADGKILGIQHIAGDNNLLGQSAVKVSIFMSIFNVHVNRIPIGGRISNVSYHKGRFFAANLDKASDENENNRVTLETKNGRKVVFVQIAGLIARRIACWLEEGAEVVAGQRFGLIRFGSRLDLYLPADTQIVANPRDKVKAGKTVIGYLS